MKKVRLIIPIALVVAASITVVSASTNTVNKDAEYKVDIAEKKKQILSEKLEEGVISQEKYDQIMEAIGSGEFRGPWVGKGFAGRWNGEHIGEWTEEQKAEWKEKMKEILSSKLEEGVISQEKYDQIIEAMESGEFGGFRGRGKHWDNDENLNDGTKQQEEDWNNYSRKGCFRGFRGKRGCSQE